jgi:hypothetical protein
MIWLVTLAAFVASVRAAYLWRTKPTLDLGAAAIVMAGVTVICIVVALT